MKMEAVTAFEQKATPCGPLESEIRARGIPVIPTSLVVTHKRRMAMPQGYRRLQHLLWVVNLSFIPRMIERFTGKNFLTVHHASFVASLFGASMLCLFGLGRPELALMLAVPFIGNMACWLLWTVYNNGSHRMSTWTWHQVELDELIRASPMAFGIVRPPTRLLCRAELAQQLDDVTVLVEYNDYDPFIVAVRDLERVYIGAYKTGDHHLDSI